MMFCENLFRGSGSSGDEPSAASTVVATATQSWYM
jgi:hypothetical protein